MFPCGAPKPRSDDAGTVFVNAERDRTLSAGIRYGPKQRFAVFEFTSGLLSVYAPELRTISNSRARIIPFLSNAVRAWMCDASERVVSIASSTERSSFTGRPVKYAPIEHAPSIFVYDFVP